MIESLTLVLTENCNSSCKYCYQKFLKEENKLQLEAEWLIGDIPKLFLIIKEIKVLHFFGGEPLIKENFIIDLDLYLDEKGIKKPTYIFSTNLIFFSEKFKNFLEKLKREKHVVRFITSIDGPKEIHDKNRELKNGISSYETIKLNYEYLIRNNFIIDTVVAVYNQEHLKKNISILNLISNLNQNFSNIENIQISCEYYVEGIKISEKKFRNLYLESIETIFNLIYTKDEIAKNYGKFIKKITEELIYFLLEEERKEYMCLNQNNRLTIFPDKKIYTCPEEYYLSFSNKGLLLDNNIKFFFTPINNQENLKSTYENIKCIKCKYIKVCHICPLEKETIKEKCEYKREYFNLFFKNLKKIFLEIESFLYFKEITKMNAKNLKIIYLYIQNELGE